VPQPAFGAGYIAFRSRELYQDAELVQPQANGGGVLGLFRLSGEGSGGRKSAAAVVVSARPYGTEAICDAQSQDSRPQ
jgi:glutamate/tyrosine decarboxylase-like PLP-dependent enzyme